MVEEVAEPKEAPEESQQQQYQQEEAETEEKQQPKPYEIYYKYFYWRGHPRFDAILYKTNLHSWIFLKGKEPCERVCTIIHVF